MHLELQIGVLHVDQGHDDLSLIWADWDPQRTLAIAICHHLLRQEHVQWLIVRRISDRSPGVR